jgi:hypothetical protein
VSALLSWPKRRRLTTLGGRQETAVVEPGRLVIWHDEDHATVYTDPAEIRALAFALYVAALEVEHAEQYPPGQGRAHLKHQRRRDAGTRRRVEEGSR